MSKMRIKKHKGVKLLETRHPPPKKNSDDEDEEEKLLQCIMCNCMTIEEYLKRHIRYNHLISKEDIIDKLYNLHYPTQSENVSTQTSVTWIDDLEQRGNSKDDPDKGKKIRPKFRHQRDAESDDNDQYKPHHGGDDDEEVLCPACGDVEDGTPMIACDQCDRWYHWACVGLNCKPPKGQEWMCTECSSKKPNRKSGNSSRFLGNKDGPGPSGSKQKFKRNLPDDEDDIKVTAVVKPKRGKLADDPEPSPRDRVAQRRLSGRGKSSPNENTRRVQISTPEHSRWEDGSPHGSSKKRFSSSDRDTPRNSKSAAKRHDHRDHSPKKKGKHSRHESDSEDNVDNDDQPPEDLPYSDDSVGDKDFEPQESDYDDQDMKIGEKLKDRRNSQQKFKKHKKKFVRDTDEFDEMSRDDMRELCRKEMINASGNRDDLEQRLRRHFRKKKETQEIKRDNKKSNKKFKLTEVTEGDGICKICGLGWNLSDDLELGPLYKYGICQAHLHCLMFSSGLIQGGDEKEGIVGFMPDDVLREWQRGAKLKCTFCKEIYATVGCCQRTCMKTYHLPCGIKYGALNEYYGNFDSYCPLHRSKRTPKNRAKNYVLTDLGLVPEHVDMEAGFDSEKYKTMLKKLESETERRKSTEKKETPKSTNEHEYEEPPFKKDKKESKKRQEYFDEETTRVKDEFKPRKHRDKKEESSEEESELTKKRPGPKSKTMIKKKKVVEEFEVIPPAESSDDDTPLSKIKKIKPTSLKKNKLAEDKTPKHKNIKMIIRGTKSEPEVVGKREGKRIRKSTFGSDIYSSAQDELKKLLEKKHLINIDDTFVDLAGTRRQRAARTKSVVDGDNDEDDEDEDGRSQSRSGRKCVKRAVVEVDDEEDFGSKTFTSKLSFSRKLERKGLTDDDDDEQIVKGDETIESVVDFLGDSKSARKKKEKLKKRNSGPDSTDELIESEEENQKEDSPENDSKSPPTPNLSENEFEDTEQDSGHENLDQNDGFTDCADLSNVTSDEGTDADIKKKSKNAKGENKVMFNDEENDEQIDLSGLIKNLENEEEKKTSEKEVEKKKSGKEEEKKDVEGKQPIDTAPISRFKCPFCSHHSKSKKRIEQHISYSHNRKNLSKNLANKQEMMIFIGKNVDKDVSPVESSQYSSDDMSEAVEDKDEATKTKESCESADSSSEQSGSKRLRKNAGKGDDFILWADIGKKTEKKNKTAKDKEDEIEKTNQEKKEAEAPDDATPTRKRGRKPKQETETPESKKGEESTRPRRGSPRKEKNDIKIEEQKTPEPAQEGRSNLRGRPKKTMEPELEQTVVAQPETVETPKAKRGRPKKTDASDDLVGKDINEMVIQITPKIEEPSQSDIEMTPKRRRTGRPKKEEEVMDTDKSGLPEKVDKTLVSILKKSPGRPGRGAKEQEKNNEEIKSPAPTPTSSRRSGRSNKEEEKLEEEIKSPVTITITNKRTRQNPKQDLTESDDKNEDEMKEENLKSPPPTPTSTRKNRKDKKEELNEADDTKINLVEKTQEESKSEQKQPEATQSDADTPPKVSRRGRKPKMTFPARNTETAENNEPVPNDATTSSRRGSLSPTGSNNESLFECLKCGTKIMQTQELVTNHLKRHKYTLDEYIDTYSTESNSDNFSAIILWQTASLPSEPTPPKRGSRKGGKTPVSLSPQDSNTEELEEHKVIAEEEKVKPAPMEEKKSSPFKLLFSTVGDYNNDDTEPEENLNKEEEDPLSMETSAECTPAKESNEVDRETVTSPVEESTPEKVEPDSTTSLEDVFDLLVRKTPRSSGSSQKMPGNSFDTSREEDDMGRGIRLSSEAFENINIG